MSKHKHPRRRRPDLVVCLLIIVLTYLAITTTSIVKDHADQVREDYEARKMELEEKRRELITRIEKSRHFGAGRLLRAFPDMKHREHSELLELLRKSSIKSTPQKTESGKGNE